MTDSLHKGPETPADVRVFTAINKITEDRLLSWLSRSLYIR